MVAVEVIAPGFLFLNKLGSLSLLVGPIKIKVPVKLITVGGKKYNLVVEVN